MSISFTITDPENTPRAELLRAIAFLSQYAEIGNNNLLKFGLGDSAPLPPVAAATIDPDDSPDRGVDVLSPSQAFGAPGAAEAFGAAGNVPGAGSGATFEQTPGYLPPAVPSAPSAAAAPAIAGGVELDASGLPHDPRIHASTKTKKGDNTWTARRGVDPAVVAEVTAQLRQLMAAPTATPGNVPGAGAPATPPAPSLPPVAPAPTIAPSAPAIIPTAPAGAPPAPPAPPSPPPTVPGVDFASTAKLVSELVANGRLTQEKLGEICTKYGVPAFGMLYNRPDLVPAVHADIMASIAG